MRDHVRNFVAPKGLPRSIQMFDHRIDIGSRLASRSSRRKHFQVGLSGDEEGHPSRRAKLARSAVHHPTCRDLRARVYGLPCTIRPQSKPAEPWPMCGTGGSWESPPDPMIRNTGGWPTTAKYVANRGAQRRTRRSAQAGCGYESGCMIARSRAAPRHRRTGF